MKGGKMMYYILTSHGGLATGMKTAIEMICGINDKVSCYDLEHYENPRIISSKIEEMINTKDEYVVFTDLYGGSIQNELLHLLSHENVIVVSGMHLGLILAVMTEAESDSGKSLKEKIDVAIKSTLPMIEAFSKETLAEKSNNCKEDENDTVFEN
jgi:Phosphotransferase system, mannose/fructose-specific component IIA